MATQIGTLDGISNSIWENYLATCGFVSVTSPNITNLELLELYSGANSVVENSLNALYIYNMYNTGVNIINLINEGLGYPVNISASSTAIIISRITTFTNFIRYLEGLIIPTITNVENLLNGKTNITSSSLLDIFMEFNFETPPAALTPDNFLANAQAVSAAFEELLTALTTQGIYFNGSAYDAINYMYESSLVANQLISDIGAISYVDIGTSWNTIVALYTINHLISLYLNDPSQITSQQYNVMRIVLLQYQQQLNINLLSLREAQTSNIELGTLHNNTTLMDLAARKLDDYESWQDIVAANSLMPPYIGTGPNNVEYGQQVYLTGSTTGQVPDYEVNYLGSDIYYGDMAADMLPWTGDFFIISGYNNLSLSLGRALQTQQGSLMYEPVFGSRIPPEVGKIQSQYTIGHIKSYAAAAILYDPRVYQVNNEKVTLLANGLVQYSSVVIPNGLGVQSAAVNEVLQPMI